jgi:hypothetical protein
MGDWANKVIAARNEYATAHHLPAKSYTFDWKETTSTVSAERTADPEVE